MNTLGLQFGPLRAEGFSVRRSGITWLRDDGHFCHPNEIVAYCNIALEPDAGARVIALPFADERELQVAFAPRVAGRLRRADGSAPGGHLGVLGVQPWRTDEILGVLETPEADNDESEPKNLPAENLRLLILAGRRVTNLANVETGLLPGWHSRSRGWWSDPAFPNLDPDASEGDEPGTAPVPGPTLLSMGICDSTGPIRGESGAFLELFQTAPLPAQFVYVSDHPVTPCAPMLVEQFLRTPAGFAAIAADVRRALNDGRKAATADDYVFAGALLAVLERSPMREGSTTLTPSGLQANGAPQAILLSLNAEFPTLLRHRELGYTLHVMRHYQAAAGPAIRAWLQAAFTPVTRTVADIGQDYAKLFDTVTAATGARFFIINRMSTSGQEDITNYAAFDAPMAATLETIAAKELNLMLEDLAVNRKVTIIDVDAIAAEFGAGTHLPDGMHQSGPMQAAVRMEIFRKLALV